MLSEGQIVYYLVNGSVFFGRVINAEETGAGFKFSIDSYGGCEGHYVIDGSELHQRVFLSEAEAQEHARNGEEGFYAGC